MQVAQAVLKAHSILVVMSRTNLYCFETLCQQHQAAQTASTMEKETGFWVHLRLKICPDGFSEKQRAAVNFRISAEQGKSWWVREIKEVIELEVPLRSMNGHPGAAEPQSE